LCDEKAVILDFDGVITRLNIDWSKLRAIVAEKTGLPINSFLDFFEEYYGTKEFALVHRLVEDYEVEAVLNSEPYKDAVEFLKSTVQYNVYIASMQSEKSINLFLQKHSLTPFFKEILGRGKFGSKKNQLTYLIKKLGLPKSCIFFIDDSLRNIKTCRELGIQCIHLNRRKNTTLTDIQVKIEEA